MDEPHWSDRHVHITGVGSHLIPKQRIGRFCTVAKYQRLDGNGTYNRLLVFPESLEVKE